MTNLSKIISVLALSHFIAVWIDILPEYIDRAASLAIAPLILLLVFIATGGGLNPRLRKIFKVFSFVVLVMVIILTIYYVLQGGIGAIFPIFFGGLACAAMYIVLLIVEAGIKIRGHYAANN